MLSLKFNKNASKIKFNQERFKGGWDKLVLARKLSSIHPSGEDSKNYRPVACWTIPKGLRSSK